MKKKIPCRIVSRRNDLEEVIFVIQLRHPIFWWKWKDIFHKIHPSIFDNLDIAIKNVKYFDGSYKADIVVWKDYERYD